MREKKIYICIYDCLSVLRYIKGGFITYELQVVSYELWSCDFKKINLRVAISFLRV